MCSHPKKTGHPHQLEIYWIAGLFGIITGCCESQSYQNVHAACVITKADCCRYASQHILLPTVIGYHTKVVAKRLWKRGKLPFISESCFLSASFQQNLSICCVIASPPPPYQDGICKKSKYSCFGKLLFCQINTMLNSFRPVNTIILASTTVWMQLTV